MPSSDSVAEILHSELTGSSGLDLPTYAPNSNMGSLQKHGYENQSYSSEPLSRQDGGQESISGDNAVSGKLGMDSSGSEILSEQDAATRRNEADVPPDYNQVTQHEFKETLLASLRSSRWAISFAIFVANFILAALRINMSLAILCMVDKHTSEANHSDTVYVYPANVSFASGGSSAISNASRDEVTQAVPALTDTPWYIKDWTRQSQAWILSGFFYGFLSTQILGGYLASKFGGRKVMLAGNFLYGLATLFIPLAARIGLTEQFQHTSAYTICALRVVCGMSAGLMMPCFYYFWGKWLPPLERSKHVAFSLSGVMVGNVLMLGSGGYICESTHIDGGWPLIFYGGGGLSLMAGVLFWFTLYDSPLTHPRISKQERTYILQSLHTNSEPEAERRSLPLRKIFASKAVWSLLITHFMYNFGDSLFITKISALFEEVLGYDINQNGLMSTLPYIAMFVMSNSVARIIDHYRVKGTLSTVMARKISTTAAMGGSTVLLLTLVHLPMFNGAVEVGTTLMITAVALLSLSRTGFMANYVDIAPRYAGEIYAIANTFASLPGTFAPQIANFLTPTGSVFEWRSVFYLWSGLFMFGLVIYCILAEGEEQEWAKQTPMSVKRKPAESLDDASRDSNENVVDIKFEDAEV